MAQMGRFRRPHAQLSAWSRMACARSRTVLKEFSHRTQFACVHL